jgi:hypothetical protein
METSRQDMNFELLPVSIYCRAFLMCVRLSSKKLSYLRLPLLLVHEL